MTPYLRSLVLIALVLVAERTEAQGNISIEVLEAFRVKGSTTYARALSNTDLVSGFCIKNGDSVPTGFIRSRNGSMTKGIIFQPGYQTFLPGINSSGLTVGYSQFGSDLAGFFYQGGVMTPYNVPILGAKYTVLLGVNDAGDFTGYWGDGVSPAVSFASRGGTISNFYVPGIGTSGHAYPQAINNKQEVVGWYYDPVGIGHGFRVQPNGDVVWPIDFPGASHTFIYGVNDDGLVVGTFFENALFHGFVIQRDGQTTQLDVPNAESGTDIQGINNDRRVCGYYYSGHTQASFIGQLTP